MKKKTNVFIFTRPIQYANAKNILSKSLNDRNILFVYPNFKDGKEFYKNILKYEKDWDAVIYIRSRLQLLFEVSKIKIGHLYLSTDLGFYSIIQLFSEKCYHYEEGWGTYSRGENKKKDLKNKLGILAYKAFGSGNHMGSSLRTNGVVIYNKKLHNLKFPSYNKEIQIFPIDFKKNVLVNLPFFERVYSFRDSLSVYKNKSILIYATGWKVDENILEELTSVKNKFDYIFIKFHPHIKEDNNTSIDFVRLEQNVLLELYISELLTQNNDITVWHDNSSSIFYYLDEIKVRNIGRSRPEFNGVFNFFIKKRE